VWKRWGIAQAINTGDAMFTLAHLALLGLREKTTGDIALKAATIFQTTCLQLTQGQHLDIAYEERNDLTLKDYWPMIEGKTAALLAACTELGALIAETPEQIRQAYRDFGLYLGLAFQALDDLLGIWGDSNRTGKSTASDLVEGKKTLPVLYGLETSIEFATRWATGPILPAEAPDIAGMLEASGARAYTQKEASRLTDEALNALENASPLGDAGEALFELAQKLLKRRA
jgi:geranylgeranyl diphosphate synthase type I